MIVSCCFVLFSYRKAIALGWLIGYFDDDDSESWEGWTYASAVVLTGLLFRCGLVFWW